jgi:hypothetical protein
MSITKHRLCYNHNKENPQFFRVRTLKAEINADRFYETYQIFAEKGYLG